MNNDVISPHMSCYLERLATAKGFLHGEIHTHTVSSAGSFLEAFPVPQLIIIPPSKKFKEFVVDVNCSVCGQRLHKTSQDIQSCVKEIQTEKFEYEKDKDDNEK